MGPPANKLMIAHSSTQMNPKMDQREFHFAEDDAKTWDWFCFMAFLFVLVSKKETVYKQKRGPWILFVSEVSPNTLHPNK